jgi:hypothetical protein
VHSLEWYGKRNWIWFKIRRTKTSKSSLNCE